MNKNILIAGCVGLLVGGVSTYALIEGTEGNMHNGIHRIDNDSAMHDKDRDMQNTMHSMMTGLEGKTGDALDQAFLKEMIVHHEGAVEMAQAVLEKGKHPELKVMAEAIIKAQTAEIEQMKAWQKAWYGMP